ncbi:MAG: glycosyltransferase family 4 protein [Nanoarchaeota archaeon]|nr:glycosyltransferase family 4 protein [Nanoarchaeota archaeon]
MKILFVLENYIPHIGGVEVVFKNLAEGLVSLGHDVFIVTHRLKGTKKFDMINGVKVYRVDCFQSRYWFTFLSILHVLKLARKVDIIHTTTFNGAPPAWFVSKLIRKPCLITVHEVWVGKWHKLTDMSWLNGKIHDVLERFIFFLNFDRYICVSKSTKKQLLNIGVKKRKVGVVYNGVDYEHWNPGKFDGKKIREKLGLGKNFVYLFYGRPGISKGLEYLIKAIPEISKKIPSAKLLAIVSKDKSYEKRYRYILDLIKKLKIEDKVIMHNPVSYKDLPSYIKAADCVVVPSLAEGFGFAAAEACAMDVPVVASNTTSLPEVISKKYLLIEPKNSKAIAEAIFSVYKKDYKKSKKKLFYIGDNINNYVEIYNKLLVK